MILSLPTELQDIIYEFDGRYKIAMKMCFKLIIQRGRILGVGRFVGNYRSYGNHSPYYAIDYKFFRQDFPEYYGEVVRRLARYRSLLEPSGHIRGVTTHLKSLPKCYCFNDALGCYKLGRVIDTIVIDGIAYKSTEKVYSVAMEKHATKGTNTVVKCIDVLDPAFQKSIKGRESKRIKVFRSLGVSENGIPGKDYYFKPVEIDDKLYYLHRNKGLHKKPNTKSRCVGYMTANGYRLYGK
jgi:hypothetical protein